MEPCEGVWKSHALSLLEDCCPLKLVPRDTRVIFRLYLRKDYHPQDDSSLIIHRKPASDLQIKYGGFIYCVVLRYTCRIKVRVGDDLGLADILTFSPPPSCMSHVSNSIRLTARE